MFQCQITIWTTGKYYSNGKPNEYKRSTQNQTPKDMISNNINFRLLFISGYLKFKFSKIRYVALADPKGGARDAPPPRPGSIFSFSCSFSEKSATVIGLCLIVVVPPPIPEILNPPLCRIFKGKKSWQQNFCRLPNLSHYQYYWKFRKTLIPGIGFRTLKILWRQTLTDKLAKNCDWR